MPLLEFSPQLNSTCSLKSSNLESLINSGPLPGEVNAPFSTFQTAEGFGLSIFHPVRSFPLNSGIGFPHFGLPVLFRSGARSPVHVQVPPSGPVKVPDSCLPVSVPSKTQSALLSSSSLGETNVRWPFA